MRSLPLTLSWRVQAPRSLFATTSNTTFSYHVALLFLYIFSVLLHSVLLLPVQGCPDVHPPPNTVMKRTGTSVIIISNLTTNTKFSNYVVLSFLSHLLHFHYVLLLAVQGCPDVHPPPNTVMKRTGTDLIIRCNHTRETWFLTCKDNQWAGEMGNCSSPVAGTRKTLWYFNGLFYNNIMLVWNMPFYFRM